MNCLLHRVRVHGCRVILNMKVIIVIIKLQDRETQSVLPHLKFDFSCLFKLIVNKPNLSIIAKNFMVGVRLPENHVTSASTQSPYSHIRDEDICMIAHTNYKYQNKFCLCLKKDARVLYNDKKITKNYDKLIMRIRKVNLHNIFMISGANISSLAYQNVISSYVISM